MENGSIKAFDTGVRVVGIGGAVSHLELASNGFGMPRHLRCPAIESNTIHDNTEGGVFVGGANGTQIVDNKYSGTVAVVSRS